MEESYSSARPVAGRLIALDFRPARPLTLLGPALAVLCGALASGGLGLSGQTLLTVVLLLLLCDALLGAWRSLWLHADWRTVLPRNLASAQVWLSLSSDVPTTRLARLSLTISQRIRLARTVVWPLIDSEITGMLIAGVLAICISVVLGLVPTILTVLAMALALLEGQLTGERRGELRAIFEIALPWLIAQTALGSITLFAFVVVMLFTLVYRALLGLAARHVGWTRWNNLAQVGIVLCLILSNEPLAAGIVALGGLAQFLWQSRYQTDLDGRLYAQRAQSYILVAMLITGLALWL